MSAAPNIWRPAFLTQLAECGQVRLACERASIHRTTAYAARKSDPEFAAQWETALQQAGELLEQEAWRRAHDGVDEPQFYKGTVCGTVRKYSDVLLIFLLKAVFPEKYREKVYLSTEQMERMYQTELSRMRGDTASEDENQNADSLN